MQFLISVITDATVKPEISMAIDIILFINFKVAFILCLWCFKDKAYKKLPHAITHNEIRKCNMWSVLL